jgi:putative sterol carrier protein
MKENTMKFMSQEWFDAVGGQLKEDEMAKIAFSTIQLGIQQVATGGPNGDIKHFLKVDNGSFDIGVGELDDPDVTLTASYDDACAIHRGELDAMTAFSSGRMLVQGNLAVLMQHQASMAQMTAAMESLRGQTEY